MTNRKTSDALYYERNKETINAKKAVRYAKNREKIRAKQAEYYLANKDLFAQKTRKRQSSKLNRTPIWVTKAYDAEIEGFYQFCQIFNQYIQNPNDKFEVDHIIPLQGKQVSGLHTPGNLQVLTRRSNAVKRNIFNPNMYPRQGEVYQ